MKCKNTFTNYLNTKKYMNKCNKNIYNKKFYKTF